MRISEQVADPVFSTLAGSYGKVEHRKSNSTGNDHSDTSERLHIPFTSIS